MSAFIRQFIHDECGATAIEYGLICALIVIACIAGMSKLGGGANGLWKVKISDKLNSAM